MATIGPSWIGRTIGNRYEIESILGRGGMSSVYRANDPNLRRKVAVKIIHQHLSDNKEFIQRFEQEAAVIAQLRHNNIVQVHDFNHEGDVYFMVMEFVPGETLAKRMEALNGAGIRLPLHDTIRILTTICEAVDYAHQCRMIHRDLKPANVMLNLLNEPILMDFGIAKIIGGTSNQTTGVPMGTVAYMSPEQVRGDQADHRSDIYSLGIMMYEMLSGSTPYQGDSTYQVMLKHINDPLPDIQLVEANTPNALVQILEKALSKNPDQRFQTTKEMATALHTAALQLQSPTERIATRHLDRLSLTWQKARDLYDEREFSRCLDKIEELHRLDPDYQEQKAAKLRQQAVVQLVEQANYALVLGDFSESLTVIKSLRERAVEHPKLDNLESQARAGLDTLALQTRFNKLYGEALTHLDNREYQSALAKWEAIKQRQGDLIFPDKLAVVKRANEGICANLYNQAITALAHKNPEQAMTFWAQIAATDSNFPDSQGVVNEAQKMIQQRERHEWRKPLLILGTLVMLLLVAFGVLNALNSQDNASAETAVTPTTFSAAIAAAETATPPPTPTATLPATATDQPTQTAVPNSTPATIETTGANTTVLAANTAVAKENVSIFSQADAATTEIAIVRADERVTVIGRSDNNNWLYVRNESGESGFVFADYLTYEGEMDSLPIRAGTNISEPTTSAILSGILSLDIYQLEGTQVCNGTAWTQQVYMRAQGVSGTVAYYWQDELVGTAVNDNITIEVSSGGGPIVGTGRVTVNGITVSEDLFIPAPRCNN